MQLPSPLVRPAVQVLVPGAYAWVVTVAPVAWAHASGSVPKAAAIAALLALATGLIVEKRWGARARPWPLWGFVLACAIAWSSAPAALDPLRFDAARGMAGIVGWGLFAFASAAPPLAAGRGAGEEPDASTDRVPSRGILVALGVVLALALQAFGWEVTSVERALLVRFASLAAGIALVGAAAHIDAQRSHSPSGDPSSLRLRQAFMPLALLALLCLAGLILVERG